MDDKKLAICLTLTGIFTALPALAQSDQSSPNSAINIEIAESAAATSMASPGQFPGLDAEVVMLAQGPPPMLMSGAQDAMHGSMHVRRGGKYDDLNLTDEQYERMFQVKKETMTKMSPKIAEMMLLHMDLRDAMLQPDMDKTKLTAMQNRINALHTDISNIRFESELNSMAVLTAEQRKDMRRKMVKSTVNGWATGSGMMCGRMRR